MSKTIVLSLEPYIHTPDARLPEGVTYMASSGSLLWVDIFRSEIHKVTNIDDPVKTHSVIKISSENYRGNYPYSTQFPERIGVIFPVDGPDSVETVLFAGKYGVGNLDLASGEWEYLVLYSSCAGLGHKDWSRLRSNDGNVAPNGDLYIGIMNDFHIGVDNTRPPEGCLVRVNIPKRTVTLLYDGIYIPNSVNWNQQRDVMFLTDSLQFTIWAIPYVSDEPRMAEKTRFIDFKPINAEFKSPEPDGSVVDLRDNTLYSAVYSTSKVQAFDATGALAREFIIPDAPNVTCCCVGQGGDLFVTTANSNVEEGGGSGRGGALFRIPASYITGNGRVASSKPAPSY